MKGQEICNVRLNVQMHVSNLTRGLICGVRKGQFGDMCIPILGRFSRIFGREIASIIFATYESLVIDE